MNRLERFDFPRHSVTQGRHPVRILLFFSPSSSSLESALRYRVSVFAGHDRACVSYRVGHQVDPRLEQTSPTKPRNVDCLAAIVDAESPRKERQQGLVQR